MSAYIARGNILGSSSRISFPQQAYSWHRTCGIGRSSYIPHIQGHSSGRRLWSSDIFLSHRNFLQASTTFRSHHDHRSRNLSSRNQTSQRSHHPTKSGQSSPSMTCRCLQSWRSSCIIRPILGIRSHSRSL